MIASKSYVRLDDQDVFRIGATRISLDSVVHAFLQGHSSEAIQDQYPGLSLEEVYGALAFYLANRNEVHQYLEKQQQRWEELKQVLEQNVPPVVVRLRMQKS
jgi:uncharacterized protein (DUF433 family)